MRLIDRDSLKHQIIETYEYEFPTASGAFDEFVTKIIPNIINNAPTVDAVEVVRCKDCKHNGTWQCHMEYDEYHPEADMHRDMHGDDDFCSYGEKEAT